MKSEGRVENKVLSVSIYGRRERSESTSKVYTSEKVSLHLSFNIAIVRILIFDFTGLWMLDPMRKIW